jgi:hypothetical protein
MSGTGRRFACEAWVLSDNILTILSSFSVSAVLLSNVPRDMGGNVTLVEPEPEAELEAEL